MSNFRKSVQEMSNLERRNIVIDRQNLFTPTGQGIYCNSLIFIETPELASQAHSKLSSRLN